MGRPGRRTPRLAAAGGLVAVVLSAAVVIAASDGATGPAVIRLTDLQTKATTVRGGSIGKVEIVQVRLFGSGSRKSPIGHGIVTCMVVTKRERSCQGTYLLPRGMILTNGILQKRLFYTAAVTGGTGLYDNARGTLTVTASGLKPRREILIFRLSG